MIATFYRDAERQTMQRVADTAHEEGRKEALDELESECRLRSRALGWEGTLMYSEILALIEKVRINRR